MRRIFCMDFDGTVTLLDSCQAVCRKFSRTDLSLIEEKWQAGEISTRECARLILKNLVLSPSELQKFLAEIPIDSYFKKFLTWCQKRNYPVIIISDGYDLFIKYLLKIHGIKQNFSLYCNELRFDGKTLAGYFPYDNPSCGLHGVCKSAIIDEIRKKYPNCELNFIGDGSSDYCAAKTADVIWAKNKLAEYCRKKGIPYLEWQNFHGILKCLKNEDYR